MPEKLDRCVSDVKSKGGVDNPWAVCNASLGKKEASIVKNLPVRPAPHVTNPPKGELNQNRMAPFFNPPLKKGKIEPQVNKTTKGIGGMREKQDSALWKDLFDAQLKRNVKEPKL